MVSGWAVKELGSNAIDIRTVSPTERAAKVNWLTLNLNLFVTYANHLDEEINQNFDTFSRDIAVLVKVTITEQEG